MDPVSFDVAMKELLSSPDATSSIRRRIERARSATPNNMTASDVGPAVGEGAPPRASPQPAVVLATRFTTSTSKDDTRVKIGRAANEPLRSLHEMAGDHRHNADRFTSFNLAREVAAGLVSEKTFSIPLPKCHPAMEESIRRAERIKYRGGVSYAGFERDMRWFVAIVVVRPYAKICETYIGAAYPMQNRTVCLGHRRSFSTASSLTPALVFQQDQRRIAFERLPKKPRDLKVIAAMNGEMSFPQSISDILDQREEEDRVAEGLVTTYSTPRFSDAKVRDRIGAIVQGVAAPPLRHHKDVAPTVPPSFVKYDNICVELQTKITSTLVGEAELRSPLCVTRLWAAAVARIEAQVHAGKHNGFVKSCTTAHIAGPLMNVLTLLDGLGACTIDVTSANGDFRHSFCFDSR